MLKPSEGSLVDGSLFSPAITAVETSSPPHLTVTRAIRAPPKPRAGLPCLLPCGLFAVPTEPPPAIPPQTSQLEKPSSNKPARPEFLLSGRDMRPLLERTLSTMGCTTAANKNALRAHLSSLTISQKVHHSQMRLPPPTSRLEKPSSNKPGGMHNLFTHCPKDPNCEICRQTVVTRGPCKINPCHRADRQERADNFGDIIPADHEIIKEQNESRPQHYFSAVVRDLTTLWIQSSLC